MSKNNIVIYSEKSLLIVNNEAPQQNGQKTELKTAVLKRDLSLVYCISFIVSGMVGSGIFISPALVAKRTPNTFVDLCVWSFAVFVSLFGSLCYVEVISVIKKAGSAFIVVHESYGNCFGFIILWTSLMVLNPFGFNVLMLTYGTYICSLFIEDKTSGEFFWMTRAIGLILFYIIALVCCMGVRISGIVQKFITCVQAMSVLLLAIAGIYNLSRTGNFENFKPEVATNNTINGLIEDLPSLGTAIFTALYCFDGWYLVTIFVEEIKNPKKNIRILAGSAVPIVGFIYLVVNLSALGCLSHKQIGSTVVLFEDIFEISGLSFIKYIVPILVSISCAGTTLGIFFNGSRFLMSAAREGLLPKFLSLIHPERGCAIPSIILMCIIATITLLLGFDIEDNMLYFNVAIWIEYGVCFSTVLYWRYKQPKTPRCYRTWLSTPIILMMVAVTLTILTFIRLPMSAVFFSVTIFSGAIVYYICVVKNYLKCLECDRFSGWLVKCTSLVVNEVNKTGWK